LGEKEVFPASGMEVLLVLVLQEEGKQIEQLLKQLQVAHVQVASMKEHVQHPEANEVTCLISNLQCR
jgi:hypothetical protein